MENFTISYINLKAYAKVNLGLNILGKREDGYHNLDSIIACIDMYDEIKISLSDKGVNSCSYSLGYPLKKFYGPDNLPLIDNNTALRVADLLKQEYDTPFVDIEIVKNIPFKAGLGGSATNAGAVAYGMGKIFNLKRLTEEELFKIGADVPFFYNSYFKDGLQRIKGIGNADKYLPHKHLFIALICGSEGVSTADAFRVYDATSGKICDMEAIELYVLGKKDFNELSFSNSLERSAEKLSPKIIIHKEHLLNAGFDKVMMSGSGCSYIGIEEDESLFEDKYERLKKLAENKGFYLSRHKTI